MRLTLFPVLAGTAVFLGVGYGVSVVAPATDTATTRTTAETPVYTVGVRAGSDLYASEGCITCHTRQVRDSYADAALAPRPTRPYDTLADEYGATGAVRLGPDLRCVGDRLPDLPEDATLEERLEATVDYLREPHGIMPAYDHLSDDDLLRLAGFLLAQTCGGDVEEAAE
jgi:cbb3-type cytochrome oxidase cytochrome c subunit